MTQPRARLIEITAATHEVDIDLVYATAANLTGHALYRRAHCLLLEPAEARLRVAVKVARSIGTTLRIFDAYRPPEAQAALWTLLPDPVYVADPAVGSNHSRGTALDVTLLDAQGRELDMGTGFDAMTPASEHFHPGLPEAVQRNRLLLLGVMHAAGFTHIASEWWHYELPGSRAWPVIADAQDGAPRLM